MIFMENLEQDLGARGKEIDQQQAKSGGFFIAGGSYFTKCFLT